MVTGQQKASSCADEGHLEPRARHESQSPLLQKHASPLARASGTGEERVRVRTEHGGPAAAPLSSSWGRLRRYARAHLHHHVSLRGPVRHRRPHSCFHSNTDHPGIIQ